MARAIVTYRVTPPILLTESHELYLDRQFLTAGRDASISRAPNAPLLCHVDGRWFLRNDPGMPLSVYVVAQGRRFPVPERCWFRFDDGLAHILAWEPSFRIDIAVEGSEALPQPAPRPGIQTQVGVPGAVLRVQDLLLRRPRHKAVLAAYYREFFQPGIASPHPLDRAATLRCLGLTSYTALEKALNDVSETIWGDSAGHRHELPMFLIRHHVLRVHDQGLVPHKACAHGRRIPA